MATPSMAANARRDGRQGNQLRPPAMDLRPLLRADGSARFRFGDSAVVAAVFGPREPRSRHRELFDRATLEIVVRPAVGIPGPKERQMEAHLARQLEHVVLSTEYPRTQISVVVQLSSCDGSVAACAANAAALALLDAGVAMRATALSVAVAVKQTGGSPVLWLDPTAAEEAQCESLVTLAVDSSRNQLVSNISSGAALDAATWASCIEAGAKSCKVLEAFMRMSLQKRLETFLKPS
ncbi:unnamed protein product [Effrenium voratum]|uniref:Uncharacterized protein n=1 Tax=Effrenium voratum TaxID=2562239 RepID=A0AA36NEW7_9DINO|nr:unnamed protein product [Effrenium voratum]CAJ1404527.1 unnamed protein product [Effrenium voratum]CAJ1424878.1 unnamed protein product [Effrenium voratum]